MIQDIAPHTYHNEYKPVAPDADSVILAYENGKVFFHKKRMIKLSPSHIFVSWNPRFPISTKTTFIFFLSMTNVFI